MSAALSDGPAGRARYWLMDYWDETDPYVAKLADCSKTTVLRARRELEHLGVIPVREPGLSEDSWHSSPTHHSRTLDEGLTPRQRALIEVEADPGASNQRLSERAGCSRTTVYEGRLYLERAGEIPVGSAIEREKRSQLGEAQQDHKWLELPPRPASMARGLCVTHPDPDLWHRPPWDHAGRAKAISVCQRCPALADCAEWSLYLPSSERYAIYGGMTALERARRRRERKQREAQAASAAGPYPGPAREA